MREVEPLTQEILTEEEVQGLIESSVINKGFDQGEKTIIYKGWVDDTMGERHDGFIVSEVKQNHLRRYFMEVIYYNINFLDGGYMKPKSFHKLISIGPCLGNSTSLPVLENGDIKIARYGYYSVIMTNRDMINAKRLLGLDMSTPVAYKSLIHLTPQMLNVELTLMNKLNKSEYETYLEIDHEKIIDRFSTGDLPPVGDNTWYDIMAIVDPLGGGDYSLERKIKEILRERGHELEIDTPPECRWLTGISVRRIICDGERKAFTVTM